jgi:hypothetical protein
LWKEDPESYLTGGVNLVPLAPLANVPGKALPGVVRRMAARINAEPEPRVSMLRTATYLLMGLRYSEEVAFRLLEGVQGMKEGPIREAQRMLLILGEIRFGTPRKKIRETIEMIRDLEHLERLSRRLVDASISDWTGLLDAL